MPQDTGMPPQHQERQPGIEGEMTPRPSYMGLAYAGSGKLGGKVALITGGDSGIGRSVAVHFAREGAEAIAIVYLDEHDDARETKEKVEAEGARCLLVPGDLQEAQFCAHAVQACVEAFGRIDVLVNNAAVQYDQKRLADIDDDQLERTFRTNVFSMFYVTRAALEHMSEGSTIINSTSVTAFRGSPHLMDYASTKGAILAFTRSLALNLAESGIRVNAVAPGPIWTPLIPASFDPEKVSSFGTDEPLGRPGQPEEVAPSYVFLACRDSSYMTGQTLHPNGGEIVGG
ncbi:MAG: SDR family oxidoreductase [Trueperaceae bacterium]|nr:SDR family oxidoreductase [Trueperaceae bacterium]